MHYLVSYGFKTDHSTVSMVLNIIHSKRGPGSFKTNNSILLENDYQETVREAIREITNINKDANPNTLWELIKGTIRNKSMKYSSEKRIKHHTVKQELLNKIQKIQNDIENSCSYTDINIVTYLENAKQQMTDILETWFKGILIRSKAEYIEGAEQKPFFLQKRRTELKQKLL